MSDMPNGAQPGGAQLVPQQFPIGHTPLTYSVVAGSGMEHNPVTGATIPVKIVELVIYNALGQQHYFFTEQAARSLAHQILGATSGLVIPQN